MVWARCELLHSRGSIPWVALIGAKIRGDLRSTDSYISRFITLTPYHTQVSPGDSSDNEWLAGRKLLATGSLAVSRGQLYPNAKRNTYRQPGCVLLMFLLPAPIRLQT